MPSESTSQRFSPFSLRVARRLHLWSLYSPQLLSMSVLLIITILVLICAGCTAWSPGTTPRHDRKLDRRGFISSAIIGATTIINTSSSVAHAASKDEENIVKGYNRLQYLLDNWEEEVCVCVCVKVILIWICAHHMFIFTTQTYLFLYTSISHCRLLFAKLDKRYVYIWFFINNISCAYSFSQNTCYIDRQHLVINVSVHLWK